MDEAVVIMRRPDGIEQPLYGPRAEAVAKRRAERDGWVQVYPEPAPEPEPAPAPKRASKKARPAPEPAGTEDPA